MGPKVFEERFPILLSFTRCEMNATNISNLTKIVETINSGRDFLRHM